MNKKIGIMQPYLFPYLGYFQLCEAVDILVFLDDVTYIKKGFINRNNILLNKSSHRLTFAVQKASQNKLINQLYYIPEYGRIYKVLSAAYSKSNFYPKIQKLISEILEDGKNCVSSKNILCIKTCCNYIGIKTEFYRSSELCLNNNLRGQDRIIEICNTLGGNIYVNLPGGRGLYDKEAFDRKAIVLKFLKKNRIRYSHHNDAEFVPDLSVIDAMMSMNSNQIRAIVSRDLGMD